ncbi:DUF1793-domain-containing protein [Fomitiporia mediterranea MF3/22]|uniref:DUF1793-domain-containing protein n=1 Tax=Fomitiporia mediterranea (strain MF3/22) TaxID=694068 RepID=UPI0004408FF4|nr:DUF1793-domain-containing protein [Fomitiporia mediterranea MF3/22]EJC98591.1 DUF1793-domain-containing protein [Fomitiporia mediterranea MF3/22]
MLCTVARLAAIALCLEGTFAQNGPSAWTASPFTPPAWPLAVRSPYLNSWLSQGNNPASLNTEWAVQWSGGITGWYASAVVDGQAYKLLGDAAIPTVNANQTAVEFTATRTSFIFTAGPMQINASFLSPVEPTDLVRQSMPYSYLSISASSTDGNSHSLRLYSDISGEFIAGNVSDIAQWSSSDEGEYIVLSMQLQAQQKYVEVSNHPQDATEYYAFKKISGTTTSWAITTDVINRGTAANGTSLGNKVDTNFRGVGDNWPVLGIAVDWQSVQSMSQPAVWAIAVVRGPSIQYRTSSGSLEDRYPYFLSAYGDGATAAKGFLDDFSRAQSAAATLDAQLRNAGKQISSNYADLLALVTRQALGSLDITLAKSGDGSWNSSDVKVFMKNMGGIGSDVNGVNTVDTLYAAFPLFLYLNPELGGYLLSPLLEYQDSTVYTLNYAAMNIGSSYPNATADDLTSTHDFGIEETANMLIMTLAYSQRSGNGTFIGTHYALLRKWAEYLGNNTLTPSNQRSADSFVLTANQTNLALKGIIGIASMAKISEIAGNSDDQKTFNASFFADTAFSYISQWQNDAVASDNSHINFFYGKTDSNGLIYNLYADKLLQLNLVSSFVYDAATVFYNSAGGM